MTNTAKIGGLYLVAGILLLVAVLVDLPGLLGWVFLGTAVLLTLWALRIVWRPHDRP